ncbi:Protein FAR1-RELATED SEQUENCE 5, partial [Frankliniella fusca]
MSLPEIRKNALQGQAEETAKLLFEGGVKPSKVRSLLRDYGCGRVNARDLANLRQKWEKERTNGQSDEERLNASLQKLIEDYGAYVYVGREDGLAEEQGELQFLFIQTPAMKQNVVDYGVVLIVDHTYKVNRNRMPVCVLMVMDGNGSGRVAGYAFVINELATTVTAVLKSFRDAASDEVADKIKTVIIDKDPSEIVAILNIFPDAKIQLCLFHVSKIFKEKSKKESEEVKSIIEKMKYADPVTFDGLLKNLEAEASPGFYKYFYDKWAICPHAWSFKDKQQSINLGNSTTNRVECHNSKIKMNKEDDVFFRDTSASLKKAYLTTSDDPLSAEILKDLTKFCARLLLWELEVDTTKEEVTSYEASTTECKCVFSCSYGLPCRHKFYCRREAGEELYKRDEIDKMWWKTGPRHNTLIKHPGDAKQIVMPTKSAPKHHNEKYSAAMQTCKQICN